MLKCNATVDFDPHKGIYTVTVTGENGVEKDYMITGVDAHDQTRYKDPMDYAAMKAIEIFVAQHEQKDA